MDELFAWSCHVFVTQERDIAAKSRSAAEALVQGDMAEKEAILRRVMDLERMGCDRVQSALSRQAEVRMEQAQALREAAEAEAAQQAMDDEIVAKLRAFADRTCVDTGVLRPADGDDLLLSPSAITIASPSRREYPTPNRKPLYQPLMSPEVRERIRAQMLSAPQFAAEPRQQRRQRAATAQMGDADNCDTSSDSSDGFAADDSAT